MNDVRKNPIIIEPHKLDMNPLKSRRITVEWNNESPEKRKSGDTMWAFKQLKCDTDHRKSTLLPGMIEYSIEPLTAFSASLRK